MPDRVQNLQIWQESVDLVEQVYVATKAWPKEEIYGLTSQIRRAVVSIPANLAEGVGRGTCRETARFTQIALGSLYEIDTLCVIAERLGYTDQDTVGRLRETVSGLCRRISSFISYQKEHHDSH
jgi:four helix bundle protein